MKNKKMFDYYMEMATKIVEDDIGIISQIDKAFNQSDRFLYNIETFDGEDALTTSYNSNLFYVINDAKKFSKGFDDVAFIINLNGMHTNEVAIEVISPSGELGNNLLLNINDNFLSHLVDDMVNNNVLQVFKEPNSEKKQLISIMFNNVEEARESMNDVEYFMNKYYTYIEANIQLKRKNGEYYFIITFIPALLDRYAIINSDEDVTIEDDTTEGQYQKKTTGDLEKDGTATFE